MEPRKPREGGTAAARCSYANRLASKADNATASARNISALTTSWPQQQKRRRKQFPASSSHDNSRSESPRPWWWRANSPRCNRPLPAQQQIGREKYQQVIAAPHRNADLNNNASKPPHEDQRAHRNPTPSRQHSLPRTSRARGERRSRRLRGGAAITPKTTFTVATSVGTAACNQCNPPPFSLD
jgi:hypothetical protein